jgi:hypothetical protein
VGREARHDRESDSSEVRFAEVPFNHCVRIELRSSEEELMVPCRRAALFVAPNVVEHETGPSVRTFDEGYHDPAPASNSVIVLTVGRFTHVVPSQSG